MFQPVTNHPVIPDIEKDILAFWEENNIFKKSLDQRKDNEEFIFYDGPPFATGLPHYGHLLAGTIKDVIPRYQAMCGKYVDRVFGWDCHGLPVEYEMEKTLNLSGKKDIEKFGIDKFNESCRGIVLRYTGEWEKIVKRMGRWVDFERGYRTMDLKYMESIWWVFKNLWDSGYIYEGYKILPYCPRCATPLSNFEANQGYAEVDDPAITVRFKDLNNPNLYYLAWTTTPWTLPSNMGLAVGNDIDYVRIKDTETQDEYILAKTRLNVYYKDEASYTILKELKGSDVAGGKYIPLFEYFADFREKGAFKIVAADFVSTEDGTGIVHIAPGFGEDDAAVGKENNLPEVCPIDEECCFDSSISDYKGIYVKKADKQIIKRLKENGSLVHRSTIRHNYPHCWRDDTPLIYRAISTWFVNIDKVKDKMLKANDQIHWVPEHIKYGRFGKWLANARDWSISRNRYWGNPLPIWRNEEGEAICIGSVEELEKLSGKKVNDIHKHFIDDIEIPSQKGGSPLKRIPEVLDCWFESGSMPYAQQHYPFENKDRFERNFPADFIAEGLDQTRGWFYTLVVLASALFDKPPFNNVIVNGLILAEDGQKMSKRKKNYPDPTKIFDSYGADALRLLLLSTPVVRGEDLKFSENSIKEMLRSVIIPFWNSYSFFMTYASIDKWEPPAEPAPPENPKNPLDRWIVSSLSQMIEEVRENMDAYLLQKAAGRFNKFIEDLTNWYIRRSRRRFWKSQNDSDKNDAYQTLHFVLITFCKTAAPFIPFITEEIYRNLANNQMPESVHLNDFPSPLKQARDPELEKQMTITMEAVSLGRFLRSQHSLKVRQPLAEASIVVADAESMELIKGTLDIIKEELNVKKVTISTDDSELVTKNIKPNFKALGPKLGACMKEAAAILSKLNDNDTKTLLNGKNITICLKSGEKVDISPNDVIVQRKERQGLCVANEGNITVALDTVMTNELKTEGFAREIVSRIQNARKNSGLEVTDRIKIEYFVDDPDTAAMLPDFSEYVCNETLAVTFSENQNIRNSEVQVNEEINNVKVFIFLEKTSI
jgi:isoleucyl-tRNA synthetase